MRVRSRGGGTLIRLNTSPKSKTMARPLLDCYWAKPKNGFKVTSMSRLGGSSV
jgi:hypothetical protein